MSQSEPSPATDEVLRFEDLPPGSLASRRAVARWSDGSEGESLRWYGEGALRGRPGRQDRGVTLRSLHLRRDRDWLQS